MCEGINCGIGGSCEGGNCTCDEGYANVENYCEQTCALNPCKELIKISRKSYFEFLFTYTPGAPNVQPPRSNIIPYVQHFTKIIFYWSENIIYQKIPV